MTYIFKTLDNSISHGYHRETCFAKVVEGFEIVDRLSRMQSEDGHFGLLNKFATITNAVILGSNRTEDASTQLGFTE